MIVIVVVVCIVLLAVSAAIKYSSAPRRIWKANADISYVDSVLAIPTSASSDGCRRFMLIAVFDARTSLFIIGMFLMIF